MIKEHYEEYLAERIAWEGGLERDLKQGGSTRNTTDWIETKVEKGLVLHFCPFNQYGALAR